MPLDQIGDVYVAGRWQTARSRDRTVVTNPTTEELLAHVVDADRSDVDSAVRAADAAARGRAATAVAERCALVIALADELERRSGALSETITRENGTPVGESSHAPTQAAAHLRHCPETPLAAHYGSNAAAPFAGHKDSGLGVEFGLEGIEEYLALTSVHRLPR